MTKLATDAAERWRQTWEQGWPRGDVDAVAALYAPAATYRALAFRDPDRGIDGVRRYLRENFDIETQVTCRFGEPIVMADRAAIQWWASWIEDGQRVSMAGVTLLRFQEDGLVIDHRDYWNQEDDLLEPYEGW